MQKEVEEEGTMSQYWNRHGSCFFSEKNRASFYMIIFLGLLFIIMCKTAYVGV